MRRLLLHPRLADIVVLLGLLCAGLKYTAGLPSLLDIPLNDETLYLGNGRWLAQQGWPVPSWAPLYAGWYWLQQFFHDSPFSLHDGNTRLLTIGLPLAFQVAARASGVPLLASSMAGLLVLLCFGNLHGSPKPGHLVAIILLAGIACHQRTQEKTGLAAITLAALLAAFIRPEYTVAFLLLAVALLYQVLRYHRPALLAGAGFTVVSAAVLLATLGNPLQGDGRSMGAVRQHFALNWTEWTASPRNPWTEADAITREHFGSAGSLPAMAQANPRMLARHLLANATGTLKNLPGILLVHQPLVLSAAQKKGSYIEVALCLVLAAVAVGYALKKRLLDIHTLPRSQYALFAVLLLPGLLSCILIYPRFHYLLPVALLGLLAVLVHGRWWLKPPSLAGAGVMALLLVMVTPLTSSAWMVPAASPLLPNRQTVKELQQLALPQHRPLTVLDTGMGWASWIAGWGRVQQITLADKTRPFRELQQQHHFDLIIVTTDMLHHPAFRGDPSWHRFLKNPEKQGYRKTMAGKTSAARYYLVKQ